MLGTVNVKSAQLGISKYVWVINKDPTGSNSGCVQSLAKCNDVKHKKSR
jgi:hypothetical protein